MVSKSRNGKIKVFEKSKYKSFAEWRKVAPDAYAAAKKRGMFAAIYERFGWSMPKPVTKGQTKRK